MGLDASEVAIDAYALALFGVLLFLSGPVCEVGVKKKVDLGSTRRGETQGRNSLTACGGFDSVPLANGGNLASTESTSHVSSKQAPNSSLNDSMNADDQDDQDQQPDFRLLLNTSKG